MTLRTILLAAVAAACAVGPAFAADTTAMFNSSMGASMGAATLSEGPSGVLVRLELKGLKPGWHAIHFHAKADCSDPAFQSAGGHINHTIDPKPHGLLNPAGPDYGDLPNVWAGPDGMVHAQVFSALVAFEGKDGRMALKDADGSALVVHENPDDYTTQPIGGAGARVACAAIK